MWGRTDFSEEVPSKRSHALQIDNMSAGLELQTDVIFATVLKMSVGMSISINS